MPRAYGPALGPRPGVRRAIIDRVKWRIAVPKDRAQRTLVLAIVTSVIFHLLLLGPLFVFPGLLLPPTYVKRGEPLLVDIAPERPEEKAPLGNPSRPVGPPESRRLAAAPPSPPAKPAPRMPASRPAPPLPAAPPPVAKTEPPAPDATVKAPEPRPSPPEPKSPEGAQREAAAPEPTQRPSPRPLASIYRQQPGGGGGLQGGGRGGVEGTPIPLDTPEPKYQDYMNKVRDRIRANWIYPREAGDRNLEGQLLIEFHIAKDGRLQFIALRDSSGVRILDDYAMTAVKLAQPFPPVPDDLAKGVLPISAEFRYQIVSGLVNQLLR
jgi:protein TonB